MFLLVLGMLFATDKVCYATLSTPTSSIPPPISVGANSTISTDITTSIQATDVKISIEGGLFKTVYIRPSSISITDDGATQYDSRVSVSYEVLTANTNVRVKVTFTSIQKADDGLVIKFDDTTDVDTKSFTLDVEYCNSTFFEPTATSFNSSTTCGIGCIGQFTCNSTFQPELFTAECQDTASWNVSTAPCYKLCCDGGGLSGGAIAGIVIGCVFVVAVGIGLAVYFPRDKTLPTSLYRKEQIG